MKRLWSIFENRGDGWMGHRINIDEEDAARGVEVTAGERGQRLAIPNDFVQQYARLRLAAAAVLEANATGTGHDLDLALKALKRAVDERD